MEEMEGCSVLVRRGIDIVQISLVQAMRYEEELIMFDLEDLSFDSGNYID